MITDLPNPRRSRADAMSMPSFSSAWSMIRLGTFKHGENRNEDIKGVMDVTQPVDHSLNDDNNPKYKDKVEKVDGTQDTYRLGESDLVFVRMYEDYAEVNESYIYPANMIRLSFDSIEDLWTLVKDMKK